MSKKQIKKLGLLISLTMCIFVVTGCTTKQESVQRDTPSTTKESDVTESSVTEYTEEETKKDEVTDETTALSFDELAKWEFYYSSGAGAWATQLTISKDGSFEGQYWDSEAGEIGDDYPSGSKYMSNFSGEFTKLEKVDDTTYSMKVSSLTTEKKPETEEIIDGIRYVYSEPVGLKESDELLVYVKGTLLENLPEEYKSWISSALVDESQSDLPFYGIYDKAEDSGFSSGEKKDGSIKDELKEVEEKAVLLTDKLETGDLSQQDMNTISFQLYQLWDKELNNIWGQLSDTLDTDSMAKLLKEQQNWIADKEQQVKDAGAMYEGGSAQPSVENDKAATLTKTRVYELAKLLTK